jgi:peroxiredoxin Q/BCP
MDHQDPDHMNARLNEFARKASEAWLRVTNGRFSGMPAVGDPAPDFALPDQDGTTHYLADYRGRWVVLFFYPEDDSAGCTVEACRFEDGRESMAQLEAAVIGISTDDAASHRRFASKHGLGYPLLSDGDCAVSRRYGVLWSLADKPYARRRTFVIDPFGRVVKVYLQVSVDNHAREVAADLARMFADA